MKDPTIPNPTPYDADFMPEWARSERVERERISLAVRHAKREIAHGGRLPKRPLRGRHYWLRVLAEHEGGASLKEIARHLGLSQAYVAQQLRMARWVRGNPSYYGL